MEFQEAPARILEPGIQVNESGRIITTVYKKPQPIDNQPFDMLSFLKSTPLFKFEKIGETHQGAAYIIKLTKINSPS